MTKERLRRLLGLTVDLMQTEWQPMTAEAEAELEALQAEFEAWEPEKDRMALTRQELLELLFRMGRIMPWEREELERLRK